MGCDGAGRVVSRRPPFAAGTARPAGDANGLRALREQPALADDQAVARRLSASALSPDDSRWARAWLVCSQATLMADPRYGIDPTADLVFDPRQVPAPKGMADVARRVAVLDTLLTAGVLRPVPEVDAGVVARLGHAPHGHPPRGRPHLSAVPAAPVPLSGRVSWTPAVCMVHSAAVTLDWPHVVSACGREPAALLVARTLAEFLLPLDAWSMVPRRDLVERTGYQQKQVRVALRRLAVAGLLEAEGESGRVARYRFAAPALRQRWSADPTATAPSRPAVSAAAAAGPGAVGHTSPPGAPAPDATRPAANAAEGGIEMLVGGVTVRVASGASLDIAAGARARVEVGPDGRLRLSVSS